ncbi:hypothetical protein CsatB_017901 [Cannabis sativa]|uniref:Uncharacterized protein n=2 Tax=Cannabis sativa TaxID=3483 RepID=A0AB40EBT2_CANSA|nr:uncharacterized protein LOC115709647 [Cannabis sativa]KAF4362433.1 hypothetical protein F8388_012225 [Cannabis sativa]KAF4363699.1 hypothetical protein G4B88_030198 [Cannabis sativa]
MADQDPEMTTHGDPESFGDGRTNTHFANSRCSCFFLPCFGSRRSSTGRLVWWERIRAVENDHHWWYRGIRAFKKLREWSEIVAGPKWKTFIRRLNRNKSNSGNGGGARHGKFQYDPLSYSLNFDDGPGHNCNLEEEEYDGFRDFSTRYAAGAGSGQVKSVAPIELGKDVAVYA